MNVIPFRLDVQFGLIEVRSIQLSKLLSASDNVCSYQWLMFSYYANPIPFRCFESVQFGCSLKHLLPILSLYLLVSTGLLTHGIKLRVCMQYFSGDSNAILK